MNRELNAIRQRLQLAQELADEGGPGLSQSAMDVQFVLGVLHDLPDRADAFIYATCDLSLWTA